MTRTKTRLLTAGIAIFVLLAAAFFAIPLVSRNAGAEAWSGDIADDFGGGSGEEGTPYLIENGEQLAFLAQQVNENGETYAGVYFKLTDDIDLGGREWTPISYGGYDKNDNLIKETKFEGTFDGAGFTISNLAITENGANKHTGLFGRSSGTIKNLYLDNANIESYNGIGAICAYNSGTIEACGVLSGTLKTAGNNGGNVGGICEDNSGTISKCYNLADIVGGSENGGICANNNAAAVIKDCYNGGGIAAASGISNGGISAKNSGEISRCFNFGKLGGEGAGGTYYGVCGNGTGKMTDCFNDSTVSDVPVKGFGATTTNVENKTTMELCSEVFNGLGTDSDGSGERVWHYGGVGTSSADPDFSDRRNSERFRIAEYKYPSLNGVSKEVPTAEVKIYYFRNGNGGLNYTADTYTVIETAQEFLAIGQQDETMWAGSYVLGADIDLEGRDVTPIGNSATPFTGKFSGSGYSIKNVKIEMPDDGCVGLFGGNSGVITDLYVENAQIVGQSMVGGICGRNETNGIINNCAFLGTAQATFSCVGGLCGFNYGTLENCYSIGAGSEADFISQNGWAGGVCGQNDGTIKTCYSVGEVSGERCLGSVVGNNNGTVTNCYYDKSANGEDIGAIGSTSGSSDDEANSVTGLAHDVLCGGSLTGFKGSVWEKGSTVYESVNGSAKLRKTTSAYPTIIGVGEAYSTEKYEYNYGAEGAEDWREITLITSAQEFNDISKDSTANYALANDIDFKNVDVTPIYFKGKLGGNGRSVKNVKISGGDSVGLFADNSGLITDLYVENAEIAGNDGVGGICGRNIGTIRNCAFLGTVKGTEAVGGICGATDIDGVIENCYAIGDIIGDNHVGGLCGLSNYSKVKNCYSACTIHDGSDYLEALFGDAAIANADDILNCYYDKNVGNMSSNFGSGLTTAELCKTLPTGFGSEWEAGRYDEEAVNDSAKLRKLSYTYPSLKVIGNAYSVAKYEYNYGADGTDDWQECTPITTADEFLAIGKDEAKWAGNYALANDIDLTGKTDITPIGGTSILEKTFTGKFGGNGCSIKNLVTNKSGSVTVNALFGYNYGLITDLYVENAKIEGYGSGSGICVYNYGTIRNCAFYGTVQARETSGGICGNNGGTIENCYSIGEIVGEGYGGESWFIGGICGYNTKSIKNCFSACKVSGDKGVGSITGVNSEYVSEPSVVTNCYYDKTVSSLGAIGEENGTSNSDDEDNNVKGLTTAELCGALPEGFSSAEWVPGKIEPQPANGRFRTVKYTYPSLDGVGEAYYVEKEQYNYKTTGGDDWAEYTLIKDEEEFIALTENPDMWSGNYLLDADLDLTKKEFSPIGRFTDDITFVAFKGKFSGNGHTITVTMNSQATHGGLFGQNEGVIMNLAVKGDITGESTANDAIGGICGRNYNGMVYGCSFEGTINAASNGTAGGICGKAFDGEIYNCYAIADVHANSDAVGGICGAIYASSSELNTCYFVGKVSKGSGQSNSVGAIVGYGGTGRTVACYYDKEVCNVDNDCGTGVTTQKLCELSGFSGGYYKYASIWNAGSYNAKANEQNGRFRTVTCTYPSLVVGCKTTPVTREQYNFGVDGDDWAEYTVIKNEDDFITFTQTPDMWSGNYLLGADLDLTKKEFSPIGRNTDSAFVAFTGKFSGNGHTVKIVINSNQSSCGLFGQNDGVIMNLAVKGEVTGESNSAVGGVCGKINKGMIYGCSFEGTVNCTSNGAAGGICGSANNGKIYNCYAIADVRSKSNAVGGICGNADGISFKLYNSYFAGTVSSVNYDAQYVGAVIGYRGSGDPSYVSSCYYDKELCTSGNEHGTGKTTEELCTTALSGLNDTSIWNAGSYKTETNGRFRTVTCTYPSLVEGCEATSVTRKQYNFGVESDDWAEYTVIKNEAEFVTLSETPAMWSGNYILGRDLNLANEAVSPIGDFIDGDTVSFTGKFSGNGHTISNVEINDWLTGTTDSGKNNYAGVFGANSGTIMNLAVNGKVSGGNHVGGICGYNDTSGVIYGCSFTGTVTATSQQAGGICGTNGYTDKQSKIINCYAIADVDAGGIAGGVCGENHAKVEYCYSAGNVTVGEGFVYDPVCFNATNTASSNYCYYNSDLCGSGRMYDGTTTKNTALTTQALCGDSLPAGFSADIWSKGSYSMAESGKKFRTVTYTYPSLNGVGKPYSVENELQYNYGYDDSDDWQKCTRITTYEQFAAIGNDSSGDKALWKKNYVLGADIDLGGKSTTPIGDSSYSFTGKFSGDGHLFKNAASPLFGSNDGLIEYVTIASGSIGYGPIAGGISAENGSDGVIYACGNNADVTVTTSLVMGAGGITATNNGVISNCYNTGDVSSKVHAGGLCAVNSGTIEYSYNAGAVSGDNKTDALCIEQNGTLNTCYYNEDCGKSSFGSGLSTMDMTSKVCDGFGSLWVKKPNTVDPESCEGVAYYPSFSKDFAPSEKFTLILDFVKLGEDTPVYGNDITLRAIPNIKYANGKLDTFEDGISTIKIGNEIVLKNDDVVNGIATYKVKTAGKTTFTMVYTNGEYFTGVFTKDLVLDIARRDLTAKDFDFTPAADLVFNNKEKAASVTAKAGMEGVGDITVNYYCDGEKLDSAPINAGDYTVKISVGEGKFYNAAELEDSKWAFTIEKADAPAVPNIELAYNWQTDEDVTVFVPGLPENMGAIEGCVITPAEANGQSFEYSDRKLYFHVGPYTEDKVGWKFIVSATLSTQNYNDITFGVVTMINNKANKEAPSLDDFDLVFTENGSVITATIKTALEGVEYSFDGAYWSSVNTLDVAHDKLVTAYIRYAATDGTNASAPVSKQANSGHGTLTHHLRVEPECEKAGSLEYWECELCARYFLDEKGENETTLDGTILAAAGHTKDAAVRENEVPATCTAEGSYDEVVYCKVCRAEMSREHKTIPAAGHKWAAAFESSKDGHWHKCEICNVDSAVEAHVSGGPATYAQAEICVVCGYEIAPRKSGGGSGGSGGSSGGGSSRDYKPAINGREMTWEEIAKAIAALAKGSSTTIELNGNYEVPDVVIKAIADGDIRTTFTIDSWRSWFMDGAEITAPAAANLRVLTLGTLDTTGIRGTAGYMFSLYGTNNPTALTVAFNKAYAGRFANLYKMVDGRLVFADNVKVDADGSVTLPDMADKGDYVIMLCEYSDRRGDVNNDGIVNIADALALLRDVFGVEEAKNAVMRDYNGDGKNDVSDARDLLKAVFFSKV